MHYTLLFLLVVVSVFPMSAQNFVGKNINEISDNYDKCYTYSTSQDLNRSVCIKESSFEYEYLYVYTDPTGIIMIQLPQDQVFAADSRYEIDTSIQSSLSDFHEGLAVVQDLNTNLLGYINTQGQMIIKPQFIIAGEFSEGLAYFAILESCMGGETRPNTMGYINTLGEKVIQLPPHLSELYGCCYFHGSSFKNGKAIMAIREYGYDCSSYVSFVIDKKGKISNQEGDLYDINYQKVKIKQ